MPKVTEAHTEARKKQILEATFRCLARNGYSRTTIRDIAREAGLSPGTIYLYFRNKEEIVHYLGKATRERTDTQIENGFPDATPLDVIYSVFEFLVGMHESPFAAEAGRVDLELWSESIKNAELRSSSIEALRDRIQKYSLLISEAQQAGEISPELDREAIARLFLAITTGLELQKIMEPDLKLDRVLPIIRALLTGSFNGEPGNSLSPCPG